MTPPAGRPGQARRAGILARDDGTDVCEIRGPRQRLPGARRGGVGRVRCQPGARAEPLRQAPRRRRRRAPLGRPRGDRGRARAPDHPQRGRDAAGDVRHRRAVRGGVVGRPRRAGGGRRAGGRQRRGPAAGAGARRAIHTI